MSKYIRQCSDCKRELTYSTPQNFYRARRNNGVCFDCNLKGNKFSNGKRSIDTKLKMSLKKIGKPRSDEVKEALRIHALKRIEILGRTRGYNPHACKFIDLLNEEKGWHLQHALNGGEIVIMGYCLDGYDKHRNIVFEYDEPYHNSLRVKRRDLIRQNKIIDRIKPNLFIRYDEQNERLYDVSTSETISFRV